MTTAEEVQQRVNLQVLKRNDSKIENILDTATQVALYLWDTKQNKWEKPEVEGTLFVYSRSAAPKYGFTIMNRLSIDNLTEMITPEINVHINTPFLLYQSRKNPASPCGIWFYSQYDCSRISQLVQKLQTSSDYFPLKSETDDCLSPINDKVDILGMFRTATFKYKQNADPQIAQTPTTPGKKVSLDVLFKSAAISPSNLEVQCSTPLQGRQTPSNVEITNNLKSLFGLSESNSTWDGNSITNKSKPKPKIYSSSSSDEMKFKPNSIPETLACELKSKLSTRGSDNSDHKNLFAIIDDESGSCSETALHPSPIARPNARQLSRNLFGEAKKTELLSPAAFKPSCTLSKESMRSCDIILHKEYLKSTLISLLEEDADFLNKIHLAYVKQIKAKLHS